MIINWFLGQIGKNHDLDVSKIYPVAFSVHQDELFCMLDWMCDHTCPYTVKKNAKRLLAAYSNEQIIESRLVSTVFEYDGDDGGMGESSVSIIITPSAKGTEYTLRCRCGAVFTPNPYQKAPL